ncbi:hypothetical protein ACWET9_24800 [Streptomyces sp. NPDC004059]
MTLAINIGFAAVCLLLAVALWRLERNSRRRMAAKQAEWLRSTLPPAKAVREMEPGFNLSLQDECELIYSMPAYTGEDRLWDAIRNDHQGDQ